MGSFGQALGGALAGVGEYAHEQNLLKLQENAQNKTALMGFFKDAMNNPNYQFMVPDLAQHYMDIVNTDLNKWDNAKMSKSHDFATIAQKAWEAHGQSHPGMQEAQQTQLPITLSTPPGVAGQQAGEADGAAHQAAMNAPGMGVVPQQQSQVPQTPQAAGGDNGQGFNLYGAPTAPSLTPSPTQPPQPSPQSQQTDMLAATTGAIEGRLPNPGPVPQVSPSPAQASASAGFSPEKYIGQRPVLTHFNSPFLTQEQQLQRQEELKRIAAYDQQSEEFARQNGSQRYLEDVKAAWLAKPETQTALKNHDLTTLMLSAPAGIQLPNMNGMMIPHLLGNNVPGTTAPPGTLDVSGNAIDPNGLYRLAQQMGQDVWTPVGVRQSSQWIQDPADPRQQVEVQVNPYNGTISSVLDKDGKPNTRLVTSMLGTASSSTDENGNTTTRETHKVAPPAAGDITPPPRADKGVPAQVKQAAADYVAGKIKLSDMPAKQREAVQRYMRNSGMQTPDALSEGGKKALADIDPVLKQVEDLKQQMESNGLLKADGSAPSLRAEYAKYRLGQDSPLAPFFTNVSFERLRSAAAAMKGTGSRAYQVLEQALQHTPNLDRGLGMLPDEPKLMYDKLNEMEKILKMGKDSVLQDERRAGTISQPPTTNDGGSDGVTELERGPDGKLRIKGQ